MSSMANQQQKRLSLSNDGLRTGVLERWSKVFDKSQNHSHMNRSPRTLPYRDATIGLENLELEDVCEEVHEEVEPKSGQRFSNSKINLDRPNPRMSRRRNKELVRPKTPGRSGLHNEKTSHYNGRPKWTSSTKVEYQDKNEPSRTSNTSESPMKQESNASRPVQQLSSNIRSKTPEISSVQHQSVSTTISPVDIPDTRPIKSPLPAKPRAQTPPHPYFPVKPVSGGESITQKIATDLRNLLFGTALASFNSDWRTQHINFLKQSSYGISFYKPGPCGVIACIQAYLMKSLLFCQQLSIMTESVLEPLASERQQALVSAMTDIIWQAGKESNYAIVALPCGETKWTAKKDYRKDGLTENLLLFGFEDVKELEKFIKRHLSFFENTSGNGCIVFLYSVILSRTIQRVRADMASSSTILMGPNETCSQAMINLLLTGRAVSHTFNGNVEYDKRGKALPHPFKGIRSRSEIGLLTLHEHYKPNEFQVGSMLKTPKYPVWVVDSTGGRYGVIFCLNSELVNDWRLERRFNLYYYNGTTKYSSTLDDIITIDTRDVVDEAEITEDTHPIDHCLRTKWPGAVIEWN